MALIVQKYGGTSVGSVERIQTVAERVQATVKAGNSVVVVVSAMGKTTDGLVKLANEISSQPSRREMDMLLSTGEQVSIALLTMALQERGQAAVSMTGAQVGIVTEARHSHARILSIETSRVQRYLDQGQVVVIAGFQGISNAPDLEITTLGRGGSDTSAVALAASLQADACEICTDVPGILTTDPRLVPSAQLMSDITCDEMLELASLGAKVLHPRAVEIARNYGVTLVVRSSWTQEPGTRVTSPRRLPRPLEGLELAHPVDAIEFDTDQAKVALLQVPDRPGIAAQLFGTVAAQNLNIDLIIQSINEGNFNDIAFTVEKDVLAQATTVASSLMPALQGTTNDGKTGAGDTVALVTDTEIAKVSIAGAGMIGRPGVAAKMFSTLAAAGVNIQMIATSEVKVSCTIAAVDCDRTIAALCTAFDLNHSPARVDEVAPIQGPAVRGVALDQNQARLALRYVPDQPGMAAKLFQILADRGISVDMIIQAQRCREHNGIQTRDIAFTVAQADATMASDVLQTLAKEFGSSEIVVDTAIAKVSVVGIGMMTAPGTAARMFQALADSNINIQMIATSEIKISCVVAETSGVDALKAVHTAFGLAGSQEVEVSA
ncbi:aspartate kinase [Leptolyngbya cf. ectocarpi LEGE 11479]|uniref:aspartate kinase n=1 Tax=Leptolyngbya cf. ectocarpi LEGE 11479 TaxID=1828722 RepID=A0A928ZXS7_LEPEC|nr:aspartate kinase [Leptolyngbya ectocarpi]MBE9069402.1 aspartate kinase [Leptolyngbya cf. ectocarpi LEGE 11479]